MPTKRPLLYLTLFFETHAHSRHSTYQLQFCNYFAPFFSHRFFRTIFPIFLPYAYTFSHPFAPTSHFPNPHTRTRPYPVPHYPLSFFAPPPSDPSFFSFSSLFLPHVHQTHQQSPTPSSSSPVLIFKYPYHSGYFCPSSFLLSSITPVVTSPISCIFFQCLTIVVTGIYLGAPHPTKTMLLSQPISSTNAGLRAIPCEIVHLILANLNHDELLPLLYDPVLGPIAAAVYFRHVTITQNGNCMEPAKALVFSPNAFCDLYAASPVPIQTLTVSNPLVYDQLCAALGPVFAQSVCEVRYHVTNLWNFQPSDDPFWKKVRHVTYTGFHQKVHRDLLNAAVAYIPGLKTVEASSEALANFTVPNCVSLGISGWGETSSITKLDLHLLSESGPCDLRNYAYLRKVTIRGRNLLPEIHLPKTVHSLELNSVHFAPKSGFAVSRFAANNCRMEFSGGIMDWTSWKNLDELLIYGGRSVHPECGNGVVVKTAKKLRFLQLDTDFVGREGKKAAKIFLPEVTGLDLAASEEYLFDIGTPLALYSKTASLSQLPSSLAVLFLPNTRLERNLDLRALHQLVQVDVSQNELTSLQLPASIKMLDVSHNELTSLVIPSNTVDLNIGHNPLVMDLKLPETLITLSAERISTIQHLPRSLLLLTVSSSFCSHSLKSNRSSFRVLRIVGDSWGGGLSIESLPRCLERLTLEKCQQFLVVGCFSHLPHLALLDIRDCDLKYHDLCFPKSARVLCISNSTVGFLRAVHASSLELVCLHKNTNLSPQTVQMMETNVVVDPETFSQCPWNHVLVLSEDHREAVYG